MDQLKRPTVEAIEAALSDNLHQSSTKTEDKQQQVSWFQNAVEQSRHLKAAILGLTDVVSERYEDLDQDHFRKVLGRVPTKEQFEEHRVMAIAAHFFFLGWHARGAVEDADRLKRFTDS